MNIAMMIRDAEVNAYDDGYNSGFDRRFDSGAKNTKIEIVKNMLIDNKNYDEIMKYTHLTESEIHNIKLNMQQ